MVSEAQHRKAIGRRFGVSPWQGLDPAARAIKEAAEVPWQCGPEIPAAPARGAMQTFTPRETVVTSAGTHISRRSGYMGRDGARVVDVWDRMELAAYRRHKKALQKAKMDKVKEEDLPVWRPPFTPGQVSAARDYLALTEVVCGSTVKCSLAGMIGGGGSGGADEREVARLRDSRRLRALIARIGTGVAKTAQRPSKEAGKRKPITLRRLVDMVALEGRDMSHVLDHFGWSATGKNRAALRKALAAALDRMQGYDLDQPQ